MLTSAVRDLVYRRFVEAGRAPGAADLARELDSQPEDIVNALRQLEAEHGLVLAPATTTVWMAHPFSNVPTDYRVSAGDGAWWANCAWDSLGIASLLGRDADIASRCVCCAEKISLSVRGGAVSGDAIVHFVVPARRFWENVAYT